MLLFHYSSNISLSHSPSVLTWSHDLQDYFLGTRAGGVHIVHVKEEKHVGVDVVGEDAGLGEGNAAHRGNDGDGLFLVLGQGALMPAR